MTGRTGRAAPAARGHHDVLGVRAPVGSLTVTPQRSSPPARRERRAQRPHDGARLDLVVVRRDRIPPGTRGDRRGSSRRHSRPPSQRHVEAERPLEANAGGAAPRRRRGRPRPRARRWRGSPSRCPSAPRAPRRTRPQLGARQVQRKQRLLAELRLGHGREHPGGDARGARSRLGLALEHQHAAGRVARSATRTPGRSLRRRPPPRHALCPAPPVSSAGGGAAPIELPTPALPGSGSTVGGDQPPSQPGPSELPYVR